MHIVFAIAGFLIGSILERHGGWLYGALAGFAIGAWLNTDKKVKKLQLEITNLKSMLQSYTSVKTPGTETPETTQAKTVSEPATTSSKQQPQPITVSTVTEKEEPVTQPIEEKPISISLNAPYNEEPYTPPGLPAPIEKGIKWVKEFFTTGNVIVKVGVTVLFFGIAFLIKYATEHTKFPIELRLAGIAVAGIVMLGIGWRLREKKTAYALVMQGGALAVLYLTVFSALRLYDLIPPVFAFALLFVFAAFSATLAVLQNSRALAVLAISGGFLAPILTSTGSGNYVALFSYYLVLNLGIFGIAWFKSWRMLNVLGFIFTFAVATAWGVNSYTHADFSKTEPFLIAFFLLYVAISVLFAIKQPVQLKGYVDSTLVFGTPLVGFGLQAGMVHHIEYALAWTSIALAAFYIGLATALWNRLTAEFRLICEAFVALGVMFATLAVPFAFDASWTSGTWAFEGAAAIWIGLRQSRLLPRILGYGLQVASAYTYLSNYTYVSEESMFLLNSVYIGALIISLSALFISFQLRKYHDAEKAPGIALLIPQEKSFSVPFLAWGLIWWTAAAVFEIEDYFSSREEPLALLLFATFTASLLQWVKNKKSWDELRIPATLLLPALYILFPYAFFKNDHIFADWYFIGWAAALAAHYWLLKHYDDDESRYMRLQHMFGFWFVILLFTTEAAWQVDDFVHGADTWPIIMTGLVPTVFMLLMYLHGTKLAWPVARHEKTYQLNAITPLAIGIGAWFILANVFNDGNARPLTYMPFVNPLDIVLAIQFIALTYWVRIPNAFEDWASEEPVRRWRFDHSQLLLGIVLFLWLNTMWLRLAHHIWHIDFDLSDMTQSRLVQTGLAILWSITGLSCMMLGAKKHLRQIWIAGAIVMAAVVVKLFMFDLANTGTIERIVSFISVGLLLLVVGYFSPVPPAQNKDKESKDEV